MNELLPFLVRHGYALVFVWVLAEQGGLPIPSAPLLLAAGALAANGKMNVALVILLAAGAALTSDLVWFWVGRRFGTGVLGWLCRISLEPDSCVQNTRTRLGRHGARVLLVSKFIPGLNTVAAPLAGVIRLGRRRFMVYDGAGALLWSVALTGSGYGFSGQLARAAAAAVPMGKWLAAVLSAGLAGYAGWKYAKRRQLLRRWSGLAWITPEDLKAKVDAGEDVIIFDLRNALEFGAHPETLPGAVPMDAASLVSPTWALPKDREIVLFCGCPHEATAAAVALHLRGRGVTQVHPLAEGYEGWRRRGYPLALG